MKGYSQIAALLEKGISVFLLLFGATMVMLMAGLIFVLLSQIGVLVQLAVAVGLIFDSAGSLEAIFIHSSIKTHRFSIDRRPHNDHRIIVLSQLR